MGVCWLLGCTVNNNPSPRLLPPLQRSFAARIATGAWIGTGSDSKQGDAMIRKVPPVFGTAEQELLLLHNVVDEREQVQDDAQSRAQTRTDQAPGPGRGEEGRMR